MTDKDLEQLLAVGYETRSFEVKGPGSLKDKAFCAKIARAVMAMGNLSGIAYVCVGIDERRMQQLLPGLDAQQFGAWSDFDDLSAALAKYSDPPVTFDLNPLTLSTGARVVVLEIEEFDDIPYVCKRTFPGELQEGRVYVRPRGKPESVPVPNASEMRELLETATGKRLRETLRRLGLPRSNPVAPEIVDRERFVAEALTIWQQPSPTVQHIAGQAHFDLAIRPSVFDAERLAPSELESFVIDNTVRLRGWPVPFAGRGAVLKRFATWVGEDLTLERAFREEAWRMTSSGQFLHRRILANGRTDTADRPEVQPRSPRATGAVVLWDVLLYAVEVAEFGSKAAQALGLDAIAIQLSIHGIAGRELISGDWKRELHGPYIFAGDAITTDQSFGADDILARTREAGVQLAQGLLRPFGLDVPDQVLIDWQDAVFSRS